METQTGDDHYDDENVRECDPKWFHRRYKYGKNTILDDHYDDENVGEKNGIQMVPIYKSYCCCCLHIPTLLWAIIINSWTHAE
jgi:hypothetical protein